MIHRVGLLNSESSRAQFSWTPEEAGAYTLEAAVDPQEEVLEGDEANNIDKVNVTIEGRRFIWPIIVAVVTSVITAITTLLFFLRGRILGGTFPLGLFLAHEKRAAYEVITRPGISR